MNSYQKRFFCCVLVGAMFFLQKPAFAISDSTDTSSGSGGGDNTTTITTTATCISAINWCTVTATDGSTASSFGRASTSLTTTNTKTGVFDPNAPYYAKVGEIFLSKNEVDSLPKVTAFVFSNANSCKGKGFINIPCYVLEDGSVCYIATPKDKVIIDFFDWKAIVGLENAYKAAVAPNPVTGAAVATIVLDNDYISILNTIQKATFEIYDSQQILLTTLTTTEPTIGTTIPDGIITNTGTYFIKCKVEFLNLFGISETDNFDIKFIKQ